MTGLQMLGLVLTIGGGVLAIFPRLVQDLNKFNDDLFRLIEQRTKWGVVTGTGLFLMIQTDFSSWLNAGISFLIWGTVGILIGRVIGTLIEDVGNKKQWMWVVIEAVLVVGAAYYLYW